MPLLLRAPWALKPRVVAAPVSLVDLAPTLAGLLGAAFAGPLDGRDLSRTLLAGGEPAASEVYAETRYPATFGWSPLAALRRRDLKYISSSRPELYDLRRDPGESANLLAPAGKSATKARHAASPSGSPPSRRAPSRGRCRRPTPRPAPSWPASATWPEARRRPLRARRDAGERPRPADRGRPLPALRAGELAADRRRRQGRRRASWRRWWPPIRPTRSSAASWRRPGASAARPRKALPLYRQAAAAAPQDPEAWYNLASALQEAGQTPEARQAIERALKLDATRPEAHNTLGIVELGEGRIEEARREFTAAADARSARRRGAQQPRQRPAGGAQARRRGERLPALRGARAALRRAAQRPGNAGGGARSAASRHFLISNAPWLSPRDTTRSGSTGPSPRISRGTPAPP